MLPGLSRMHHRIHFLPDSSLGCMALLVSMYWRLYIDEQRVLKAAGADVFHFHGSLRLQTTLL